LQFALLRKAVYQVGTVTYCNQCFFLGGTGFAWYHTEKEFNQLDRCVLRSYSMNQTRRTFLQASMTACTVAIAASAGLLSPRTVLAAWPKNAFEAKSVADALQALAGSNNAADSKDIVVEAPDIAENGAVVSVTVKSKIAKTEQISVLVPENVNPLCASYLMTEGTDSFVTGRIKMRKTSDVIAVVKADGKLHTAKKPVKVTLGGCGG
jgi:sulfur-oxidizing protein SoxY